ncbi:MAG TPA: TetR family transcriptional regulator [Candidatus Sulfotelmatobacter sp.]|nr:TetR family transcriptional regulator [Candidatus Sulfotelmatobacter sp.]
MTTLIDPPRPGLRERKKARTRATIQDHALRLFRERGYDETSVEDIAEAAEVSPSTFFRYFPTKEDVVLYDAFDPILIEAFMAQPPELSPIQAMRIAMREALRDPSGAWLAQQRERASLLMGVPELRRRMLDEFVVAMEPFTLALATRVGRSADDFAVRNIVAAVLGVGLGAWLHAGTDQAYMDWFDAALAHLEAGLPL